MQAPDVPDEKVDGISSDQIPALQSNAVRMELDGGFVLQKIGHNCNFFRYFSSSSEQYSVWGWIQ